jgi:6-phosphofructokinase 1
MFVKGIYEIPEVRSVTPGHLVRSGNTSAYDANFGMEGGAAAVCLLKKGIKGVTVAGICGDEIKYIKTEEAIKQRCVDLNQVAIYESIGICFGRKPKDPSFKYKELKVAPERYM